MSVAGSTRTGVTVDEVAESFMQLPRNTLSAAPGHRHARGLDAVLLAFDRKVQLALRSLCIERLELEARKRAMLERIVSSTAVGGTSRTPEVLVTLNTKILDNDSSIRRLAGAAGAATILDSLKDPEILAGLQLEVPTEEAAGADGGGDEDAARVWRRKLDTQRAARTDAAYRHAGHDAPSVTGDRDLHNVLASRKEEDGLSYYQRQQLKYGRGRRGSTSVAGAWDGVWAGDGSMPQPAEGDTGATGAGAMPLPLPVSPQVASLQAHGSPGAAAAAGQQQFNGGVGAALTRGLLAGSGTVSRPLAPPMAGGGTGVDTSAAATMTSSGGSPPGPRAVPAPPPRPPSVRTMQAFLDNASPADVAAAAAAGLPGFGHGHGHGHGYSSDAAAHASAAGPAASASASASDDPLSILLARARQLVEEPPAASGAVPEAFALNGSSNSSAFALSGSSISNGRTSPAGLGTGHHYDEYHQPLASGASPAFPVHAAGVGGGGSSGLVSRGQSGKLAIGLGADGNDRDGGSSAEDDIGDSASARAGPSAAGAGLALGAGSTLGAFKGSADARKSTFFLSSGGAGSGRRSVSPSARDADVGDETASAAGGGGGHSVLLTGGRKSMRRPPSGGANGDAMTAVSGKSGGGKSVITAFTVNTTGVLALPRHTLSAKGAVSRARGMEALLNSFPKMKQYAVREMAFDIAELVARKEAVEARLAEDPLRRPEDPPPRILLDAEQQLGERVRRLVKLCGADGAELVIAAVNDPVTREAMGLAQLEDEDDIREEAGDEDAARVWRRKLESRHVQPLRGVRGESAAALHDDPTATGGRDLHNTLNRADPAELMSYYQKQQLKYGRGRRGSTSVAGAWEALFGAPGAGADRRGQADGNTGIGRGGDTTRLGGSKAMAMATAAAAAGAGMAGGASGRFSGDRTREYARRAASAPRARALGVGSVVGGGSASGSGEGGSATMLGEVTHGVRDPGVVSPARQARMVSASPLGGGGGVVVGSGSVVGGATGGSVGGGRSRAASPAGSPSASSSPAGLEGAVAAAASTGDVQALAALALQLARQVQISGGR